MSKVIVDGVEWQEFLIEFQTQEGTFNFKLFAVDWAHAIDRLEELKATAKVIGDSCSEVPAAPVQNNDHEFKNFHRVLCERFGYTHDEVDWKRDQISLIEWIAKQVNPAAPVQEPVIDHSCKDTYELIMKWADIYAAQTGNLYAQAAQDPSKVARMADERTMLACVVAQAFPSPAAQRQWVGLTDESVVSAAARVLSDRVAASCNVDCGDMWMLHGNDSIEDARAMLEAAEAKLKENNTP